MNYKLKTVQGNKGVTTIEIIAVLAIMAIITFIVSGAFSSSTGRQALDKKTAIVISLIDQARNQTLSSKADSAYGVHFETAKAVLFVGPTYSSTATSTNVVEPINPLVRISTISLAGGGSDVLFNRLTGETAQSGTITLSLLASSTQQKVITIYATGQSQSN
jgi:Tfp pilus assembly protein FimT